MHSCLCCLRADPDKDLTTPYIYLDTTEIYSQMLKDCFDLQVALDIKDECGICEVCVGRLRDASDFKLQVQRSQAELQAGLNVVKEEPAVKSEIEHEHGTSNDPMLVKDETVFKEEAPCTDSTDTFVSNSFEMYLEQDMTEGHVLGPERTLELANASNQTLVEKQPKPEFILGGALSDTPATPERQPQAASNGGAARERHASHNNANPYESILRRVLSDTPATPEQQPQPASNTGTTHGRASDNANPYECGRCGERFPQIIILSQHISENHSKKRPSKKKPPNLVVPRLKVTKPRANLTAKSESIKVRSKSKPMAEVKETIIVKPYAPDMKIYTCNACGKIFTSKSNLYLHMSTHEAKLFSCEFCSKEFSKLCNMREHRRIHTGEKPFICDICERPFAGLEGLVKHKRTHAGEQPYYCELCKKDFGNSYKLKVHKRIHTGEKPYLCEVCDKRFTTSGSLIKHKLTHISGMASNAIDD